jgi:hypothetical protein
MPECKAQFRLRFPNNIVEETALHHHVPQIVKRFCTMGSVMKREFPSRPQTDQNVIDQVEELVAENPHSSTRRILSCRLRMHPNKVSVVQEILSRDHNSRMQYCRIFPQNLNNNDVLGLSFFTDESWFHLSGYVNKQNYRTWSVVNPRNLLEVSLHALKIGIES